MTHALSFALLSATLGVGEVDLFGPGKPPVFKEEDEDRRFAKTAFYRALSEGPPGDACARVMATYFVALADAAPMFHRRDDSFYLDPALVQILQTTAGHGAFPAVAYFQRMVRRVLIERKLPEPWAKTARTLVAGTGAPIDLARLTFLADGVRPIDSFLFILPAFIDRYMKEVALATSAAQPLAPQAFRDKYIDRNVAWGGLTLFDIQSVDPRKPASKGKKKAPEPPEPVDDAGEEKAPYYVAHLALVFPPNPMDQIMGRKTADTLAVAVRLRDKQYIDLKRAVRSKKFLVRGRVWSFAQGLTSVELSDALLFEETDWTQWGGVATPADVAACSLCVDEMTRARPPPAFRHDKR